MSLPLELITDRRPLATGAAACFPFTPELMQECARLDNFGEAYSLCRRAGSHLWLPRAACLPGVDDVCSDGEPVQFKSSFQPRNADQKRVFRESLDLLLTGESFITNAPTGWGKTYLGCALAAGVGRRTLVITTKSDALKQWVKASEDVLGVSPGIWHADNLPGDQSIVVGLVQSILKGVERYPGAGWASFGLVIIDEAHRIGAERFQEAMWWLSGRLRLGLTASRTRPDGREDVFHGHIGPVLVTAVQETMTPKVLMRKTGWRVPSVWQWSNGHQHYGPLEVLPGRTTVALKHLDTDARNAIVVSFLLSALKRGRRTLVFSDTINHLIRMANACVQAGVAKDQIGFYVGIANNKLYKGPLHDRLRTRVQATHRPVLFATYAMAAEATDIPWLDACVLASPRADVMQPVGRIRREWEGKRTPVVLDLVDENLALFHAYAKARTRWYKSIGCEIVSKD